MSIQTIALPRASKEGFFSEEALSEQVRALPAQTFAEAYPFPALYVADITVGGLDKSGEGDATVQEGPQLMTLMTQNANAFRYLHQAAFLVKRPGNPFPQFVSVGRAGNNDVVFAVDSVSKFHCYFTEDQGRWSLTDFRSTNGTELNGKKLAPTVATPVKNGDRIRFGDHVSVLLLDAAALHAKLKG